MLCFALRPSISCKETSCSESGKPERKKRAQYEIIKLNQASFRYFVFQRKKVLLSLRFICSISKKDLILFYDSHDFQVLGTDIKSCYPYKVFFKYGKLIHQTSCHLVPLVSTKCTRRNSLKYKYECKTSFLNLLLLLLFFFSLPSDLK